MKLKKDVPLVSISCITFNHASYIKESLDGFIMQKTDFKFEVLIHDDASTDGTSDIIREYEAKYPDIIKPLYETENQWSKGRRGSILFNFPRAKGKYIALCEGDDFWTDPNKLQLQVDFLESHPDYSLCFHPVTVLFENHEKEDSIFPVSKNQDDFTFDSLLSGNFIQTNSVMYRRQDYEKIVDDIMPLDWYLHLYHAQFGKIGFIDRVMSVYRRHQGGVWWKDENNKVSFWEKNALKHLDFYEKVHALIGDNASRSKIIADSRNSYINMVMIDCGDNHTVFNLMMSKYPIIMKEYVYSILLDNQKMHQLSDSNRSELTETKQELATTVDKLEQVDERLSAILNSKGWKTLEKMRSIKHKLRFKK